MYDIFFALFFTYLGKILLKTIHMKTWTLIWITSYSKMMVRDIFHFRKVQASTMGLILLWILKCIHLHIMIIFFIAAMWKHWFKSVKLILKLFGWSLTRSYTAMGLFFCKYLLDLDFFQKFPNFFGGENSHQLG